MIGSKQRFRDGTARGLRVLNGQGGFAVVVSRGLAGCLGLVMAVAIAGGRAIQAQAGAQQPEFTTLKAVFVPGEWTIFFDDFTDMAPGAAPPHFKVRGAAPDLQVAGAVRQLTFTQNGTLTPNLTALPNNFTYEAEVRFDAPQGIARLFLVLYSKDREAAAWTMAVRAASADMVLARRLPKFEELGRRPLKLDLSQPVRLALWLQDGRLRAFVNGDSQLDVNQVDLPPIDRVELQAAPTGAGVSVGFRSVRFAESAPDLSQVISSSGRYVTHGILFDTDSDRLRPESAAAIQAIAKALEAAPALKLLIEGHTDSAGTAAHNLDLSARRADAVKAVLVSQFKVDGSRLATAGLGATKPIDSNDTPQGRAQNRRVELVRQ
jgi:outer membrane protein OmpA-like peptidoglycan-associated protein